MNIDFEIPNRNEEALDRLLRMASAVARGSNVYSEHEFQEQYNLISKKMEQADEYWEELCDIAYHENFRDAR